MAHPRLTRRAGRDEGASARRYLVAPNAGQGLESPQLVMDGLGNTQVGYVFEGEHPIARYGASGVPEYYLEDGIRSVVGVVDDTGSVVETYAYDSFGVTRGVGSGGGGPGPEPDGFGFQGMWRDADGTYFVRARVYDAVTGRFLSRDPAEANLTIPETLFAYAFANCNPQAFRDPRGTTADTVGGQMAALVSAAILAAVALPTYQRHLDRFGGLGLPSTDYTPALYMAATLFATEIYIWLASDETPGNNVDQNEQFDAAVRAIERALGFKLTKDQIQALHREVSGRNLGFAELVAVGLGLLQDAGPRWDGRRGGRRGDGRRR